VADGSGSYTVTHHFAPNSPQRFSLSISGARCRVYVRAVNVDYNASLARSEFSYDNRTQAAGGNTDLQAAYPNCRVALGDRQPCLR